MIAEILFPVALDKTFYYKVPPELESYIKPGIRIYASFSKRSKVLGYVISVFDDNLIEDVNFELKKIDKIIDFQPPFVVEKFLSLASYMSEKWFSPKGMILRDFLRYLPLKLEFKDKKESNLIFSNNRFVVSSNIYSQIIKEIELRYNFYPTVIFFPNIFLLKLFERKIRSMGFDEVLVYTSTEKASYLKKITKMVLNRDFKLILSTKGGIHMPFSDGINFMVVEPLNSMYRQFDQHPYYHSVEVLLKICEIYRCSISLFSSTISPFFVELERTGKISVERDKFHRKIEFEIFDIKRESPVSDKVFDDVQKVLNSSGKVLFISYSKYSSSITFCPKCGMIKRCSECGSVMKTDIRENEKIYICSYCNNKEPYCDFCDVCKIPMVSKGYGTLSIFEHLLNRFSDRRILLIDGRIIHMPSKMNDVLKLILDNNFDIICATEIVASHLLNLRFDMIVMTVYESQYSYDYTYSERFFEKFYNISALLKDDGKLKIYTFNPDGFIFSKLSDPEGYINEEIQIRKKFHYPPYGYLYTVEFRSSDKNLLRDKINQLRDKLSDEGFRVKLKVISFDPALKIKKIRNENSYIHTSSVKLEDYRDFFQFISSYANESKLKLNIIAG